jgi:hypothetical protein
MIRWCLQHRDEYSQRRRRKAGFWEPLGRYMQQLTGHPVNTPDRTVARLIKERLRENADEERASGVAITNTDLTEALDEWIQFTQDVQSNAASRREIQTARITTRQY